MRRLMIALLSGIVAGLMLAQPVLGVNLTSVVNDPVGDQGFGVDPKTGAIMHEWADNTHVAQAGYLDIVSSTLSQKGRTYTFVLEVADDLPAEGTPLPSGFNVVEWAMWIDPSAFNNVINDVAPLFLIAVRYDGTSYSSFIRDFSTMATESLQFSVDGASLEIEFTVASIGSLPSFWWSPLVRVWWGLVGSAGAWFVDAVSYMGTDGYAYIDFPWPPI